MSRAHLLLAHAVQAARFAAETGFLAKAREAAAIGRRLEDWDLVFSALLQQSGFLAQQPTRVAERTAVRQEIRGLLPNVRDPELLYRSYIRTRLDALEEGDLAAVDEATVAIERIANERRAAQQMLTIARWRFARAQLEGRLDEADQHLQSFEGLSRDQGNKEQAVLRRYELSHMQRRLSEAEAEAWLDLLRGRVEASLETALARSELMEAYRLLGFVEEMKREFEHFATEGFSRFQVVLRQASLARLARASTILGDRERSVQLFDLLSPYGGRNLGDGSGRHDFVGAASFYLALLSTTLERWHEAAEHFEAAINMHEKMRARPLLAETEYEFAAMLTEREGPGDREKALELLNSAIAATREMGMTPLMEKALSLKLQVQGLLKA